MLFSFNGLILPVYAKSHSMNSNVYVPKNTYDVSHTRMIAEFLFDNN